jgi:hypothetical protein
MMTHKIIFLIIIYFFAFNFALKARQAPPKSYYTFHHWYGKKRHQISIELYGTARLIGSLKASDSLLENFLQNQFEATELGNMAKVNYNMPCPKVIGLLQTKKPWLVRYSKKNELELVVYFFNKNKKLTLIIYKVSNG